MPAAIPIAVMVAGSVASAAANKLSQPKVKPGQPFDPRLPTQTMDFFTQSGLGDQARSQFGQQLMQALSGSLAKFGGGPMPNFNFGGQPNFSPLVSQVPGSEPQAPQQAPPQRPRDPAMAGSVGGLFERMQQGA